MNNLTILSIWSSTPHLIHEIFADDVITQCVKIIKKRHNLRKEDTSVIVSVLGLGLKGPGSNLAGFHGLRSLDI